MRIFVRPSPHKWENLVRNRYDPVDWDDFIAVPPIFIEVKPFGLAHDS